MGRLIMATLILLLVGVSSRANALVLQITNISDLALGSWSIGDPAVSGSIDLCVYSVNVPIGSYGVTVSSPGGFKLTSGTNQLPYSVYWDDAGAGNLNTMTGAQVANGADLPNQVNAYTGVPPVCGVGGPDARLTVNITQASMTAALAGTYTGTLTILVSAN